MSSGRFIRNETYYTGIVYEFNLPTGYTCPFAKECKVMVDRVTGEFTMTNGAYQCYASTAERFPSARKHRWSNLEYVERGKMPYVPPDARHVRIHASGDFFSQDYFDMWLKICRINPRVKFWAFTKSIRYWLQRINDIPKNLILTASYGGFDDKLIEQYKLKSARVYNYVTDVPIGMPIDTNDDFARVPDVCFALINNKTK